MENASKAFIIAGSVLISLVLLTFFVFIFRRGSIIPKTKEMRDEALAIQEFNSQFTGFETIEDTDGFDKGEFNGTKKRYTAARELNNISDVVTVANLASSINYTNNDAYIFQDRLEVENSVEVIVDFRKKNLIPGIIKKQYYLIEPNKEVKTNCIYGTNNLKSTKNKNIKNFNVSNELSTYVLLENLRESKLVIHDNTNYTLYRYYFTCSCKTNERTR